MSTMALFIYVFIFCCKLWIYLSRLNRFYASSVWKVELLCSMHLLTYSILHAMARYFSLYSWSHLLPEYVGWYVIESAISSSVDSLKFYMISCQKFQTRPIWISTFVSWHNLFFQEEPTPPLQGLQKTSWCCALFM